MEKIKINWINEIPNYEVGLELKEHFNNISEDHKQFLNFSKLNIILIPFARVPGFKKTLEKHKNYFSNPRDIENQDYNESAFA